MARAKLAPVRYTMGPAVASFFRANFVHRKGPAAGKRFVFEEWQQDDVNLIFETDSDGRRMWRSILWGLPRGHGKSPSTAGFGLLELTSRKDHPDIFVGAGAKDQAATVHGYAFDLPKGQPLENYLEIPRSRRSPILCPSNGGTMRILSADGDLAHSLVPSAYIIDEKHVFKTEKQEELVFALDTAMQKRIDSIGYTITTAGSSKATLLGEQFDAIMKTHELEWSADRCRLVARDYKARSLMIWRAAPDDCDISDQQVWRAVNPASWISLEELEIIARRVPESVFRRLILNQWVLGKDAAIQPGDWDACYEEGEIPEGSEVWAGVDVGERRDTSSIVIVWPMPDERVRVKAWIFVPSEGVKTLTPLLEAKLREIASTYQLMAAGFDPWQFRRSAELLSSEGMRMVEFAQNDSHMVPASQLTHDMIASTQLVHDGDLAYRKHALAAEAKQTSRGTWRYVKPLKSHGRRTDESQKIDSLIATVIALGTWALDETAASDVWAATW